MPPWTARYLHAGHRETTLKGSQAVKPATCREDDTKGDNILVSRSDGRAMLMDFGTGLYPGAGSLTPPMGFPGTPLYRSPQSWLFEVRFSGSSTALYLPSAADDLYALGVTACRLLTGEYPRLSAPSRDEHGTLRLQGVLLPRALVRHHHIDPTLRALTLRLLSVNPEQRGTAAQLAQELESTFEPFRPRRSGDASASVRTPALPRLARWRWWALAAAGLALIIATWWALPGKPWREHSIARAEATKAHPAKVGTAGLGDAATSSALEKPPDVSTAEALSEGSPPEPVPGQVRPDPKGRCPAGKGLVSLHGGCWWEGTGEPENCQELGGQLFKGTCYVPVITPGRKRPPTSVPMKTP
ncbi:MAG: protein kinase domain-containing protein [Hyalangium sp.]|uniref:protein kinase domain-containing protein n=1 Tax=Hyalangium sp. TaxID=2028555 RepID=UPI00389B0431